MQSKITQFDRTNLKAILAEMKAAVEAVAASHGLSVKPGSCSFSPATASVKYELATVADGGVVNSKERECWKLMAKMYELDPAALDQIIVLNGKSIKIVGLNPKADKFPVVGVNIENGAGIKMTVDGVNRAWGRKPLTAPAVQNLLPPTCNS